MATEAPSWLILEVIAEKVGAIDTGAGYFTDAGANVDLENLVNIEDATFPRIAIGEQSLTNTGQALTSAGMSTNWTMKVTIEGYSTDDGSNAQRDSARLKFDLVRALAAIRAEDFSALEGVRVTSYSLAGEVPTLRRPDGMSHNVVQATATVAFVVPPS